MRSVSKDVSKPSLKAMVKWLIRNKTIEKHGKELINTKPKGKDRA